MTTSDILEEDFVKVSGQTYALISVVADSTRQKGPDGILAIKLRGVFATKEEAQAHVKRLMKYDNEFDVYLVDMYKWLALPPQNDAIDDHQYVLQDKLQELIQGHREAQAHAAQLFAERKRLIMERGLDSALTEEERLPEPTSELPKPEDFIPVPESAAGPSQ